jgi:Mg-chelatase subunit ChlI
MLERLRKPETLLVIAVVCLASAVGNGLYDDDFANLATIVFSVLGSLFLTAATIRAATSPNRPRRSEPDPTRDKAERARKLQEELRAADRPNLMGNMGGGAGPGTG